MSNKQILLILPRACEKRSSAISQAGMEHLGLGHLASYLRQFGYSVEIVNMELLHYIETTDVNSEYNSLEKDTAYILNKIKQLNPLIVGISATMFTINESLAFCNSIKNSTPDIYTLLGGTHVSVCPDEIMDKEKNVDFIIVGDGEISLLSLVKELNSTKQFEIVSGLAYRVKNGDVKINAHIPIDNDTIDSLPIPARDDLIFSQKYKSITEARITTSRGCEARCTFCCDPAINPQRKWSGRNAKLVVDEMEYLNKQFGINYFWINDDNFIPPTNAGRERAEAIARDIISRSLGIHYRALFRADTFHENDELLPLLRKSGLRIAFVGFESGSQAKLKRFCKQIKIEQYYILVNELVKNEIGLQIGFIMFDPFSTFDDLRLDSLFLYNIQEMYLLTNSMQMMDVFPKTMVCRMMEKRGLLRNKIGYNSSYTNYDFFDTNVGNMAKMFNNAYKGEIVAIDKQLQRLKIVEFPSVINNINPNNVRTDLSVQINRIFSQINERNYKMFIKYISLFEKGIINETQFTSDLKTTTKLNYLDLNTLKRIYIFIKQTYSESYINNQLCSIG